MLNFFGGGKTNTVRDNHIKMLAQWNHAVSMKGDQSQWSVRFKTRITQFVFFIILPPEFPEVAPVFKFQSPVDHPWVDSHDGVTILNENLLQWNPHCDLVRIGKSCVHEFSINPPTPLAQRAQSSGVPHKKLKVAMHRSSTVVGSQLEIVYRSKPFGLKLRPRSKLQDQGAVIYALESFHPQNGLAPGMWLVTIGQRDIENEKFSQIIKTLKEVSVPVKLVFGGRSAAIFNKPKPVQQVAPSMNAMAASFNQAGLPSRPSYGYGMPVYKQQEQYTIPVPAVVANQVPAKLQQPPQPKFAVKEDIAPPEIPKSTFDVLDKYNINQLEDLLNDNLALEQLALDIASKDLNRQRKKLREDTRVAANKNLSFKESIQASRTEIEQLRKEVAELQNLNRTLNEEKQRLAPKIDVLQVTKAFEAAAEKADEEAQELVDKFESDDIAYVTFIKKYKASRESHHQFLITKGLIS